MLLLAGGVDRRARINTSEKLAMGCPVGRQRHFELTLANLVDDGGDPVGVGNPELLELCGVPSDMLGLLCDVWHLLFLFGGGAPEALFEGVDGIADVTVRIAVFIIVVVSEWVLFSTLDGSNRFAAHDSPSKRLGLFQRFEVRVVVVTLLWHWKAVGECFFNGTWIW